VPRMRVSSPQDPPARPAAVPQSLADVFKALADETRLRIFRLVTQQELCVCEIEDLLDLPQSLVSNHLAVLRRNGLVEARRDAEDARWIFYRASGPAASELRERLAALLEVRTTPGDRRRAEQVCRLRGR
jgi:ArsR family transcriptional regulator